MTDYIPLYDNSAIVNDPELIRLLKEADTAGEISAELDARLDAIFSMLPDKMGAVLVERLNANKADMLADRLSIRTGFLERQREKWGTAFDRLRALLEAVIDSSFHEKLHNN